MKNVYLDINPIPQSLLDGNATNSPDEGERNANISRLAQCGTGVGIDLSHLEALSKETKSPILNKLG